MELDTSVTTRRKKKAGSAKTPSPPQWRATLALAGVKQLNLLFLQMLAAMVAGGRLSRFSVLVEHRSLWVTLDADALQRAADKVVILFDLHFADDPWWQMVTTNGVRKGPPQPDGFPAKKAAHLIAETLRLAGEVAREDVRAARALFGMSTRVAKRAGALTAEQIDRIADRYGNELQTRWEDRRLFWSLLLIAAKTDDREALRQLQRYSVHLLGRDILGDGD